MKLHIPIWFTSIDFLKSIHPGDQRRAGSRGRGFTNSPYLELFAPAHGQGNATEPQNALQQFNATEPQNAIQQFHILLSDYFRG